MDQGWLAAAVGSGLAAVVGSGLAAVVGSGLAAAVGPGLAAARSGEGDAQSLVGRFVHTQQQQRIVAVEKSPHRQHVPPPYRFASHHLDDPCVYRHL